MNSLTSRRDGAEISIPDNEPSKFNAACRSANTSTSVARFLATLAPNPVIAGGLPSIATLGRT